jgi:hypothetical protein
MPAASSFSPKENAMNRVTRAFPLLLLALVATAAHAVPSNKWRLEFSGAAESDGELVFAVTPDGGEPREVIVTVGKADGENQIANKATQALTIGVGQDYHVERDDGEDVLLKRRDGVGLFEVRLVRNTVQAVRVKFDAE